MGETYPFLVVTAFKQGVRTTTQLLNREFQDCVGAGVFRGGDYLC